MYHDSLQILRRVIVNYTELIRTEVNETRRKNLLHHRSIVEEAEVTWLRARNMIDSMTAYTRFRDIRAFREDENELNLADGHEHIVRVTWKEVAMLLQIPALTHVVPRVVPVVVDAHKRLLYCRKHSKNPVWSAKIELLLVKSQKLLITPAGSKEREAAESLLSSMSGKARMEVGGGTFDGDVNAKQSKKRKRLPARAPGSSDRQSTAKSVSKRMRPLDVGSGPPTSPTKFAEANE